MNIRIDNQNLRFKISEDELKALLDGHSVHEKLVLLDKTLVATINPRGVEKVMVPKLVLDDTDVYLNLSVPLSHIQELSDISPNRDGLKQKIDDGLSVTLQVDIPGACHP